MGQIKKKNIRILLTGGGSGGHVYPLLSVANSLRRIAERENIKLELFYMGPADQFSDLLREAGISVKKIMGGKYRRYPSVANILSPFQFIIGVSQALFKMLFHMPDVIFSKGGAGAFGTVLVGWFYRVPIVIHESDVVPGLNNAFSSLFARRVLVGFEKATERFNASKVLFVGNPTRPLKSIHMSSEDAKDKLGCNPQKPVTLVINGSQGARRINDFFLSYIGELSEKTQVILQTGRANFEEVKRLAAAVSPKGSVLSAKPEMSEAELHHKMESPDFLNQKQEKSFQITPYLDEDFEIAMAAADLVVGRAGSGSIATVAAFGKPAIFIPLPESANDHQRQNAYEYAKTGAALVVEETNLIPSIFLGQLKDVIEHSEKRAAMALAASKFQKNDAADKIGEEIFRVLL
ncbi:MAG: UDP-N-acetylglucosamine--N-acetylmuramyl-(pentapeptide) pyrophosphoryl-undecaprenol N-acetylglucosamine transferase [Patescibacteria group bacterium]